jgi:CheY-like chemotaxis protein
VNLAASETETELGLLSLDADAKARVRILMAEDNLVNQKVGKKILQAMGFHPVIVGDGSQAVRAYSDAVDAGETFDLILMDLQMPVMDGVEATRAIMALHERRSRTKEDDSREEGAMTQTQTQTRGGGAGEEFHAPPPRVVALTADVAASVVAECKEAGMRGFLTKPIDRASLMRVLDDVAEWVGGGREPTYDKEKLWEKLRSGGGGTTPGY